MFITMKKVKVFRFLALCGLLALFALCSGYTLAQGYSIKQYLNIRSASSPQFSPDAKTIAYLGNDTGTSQIYLIPTAGDRPRQLTNFEDNVSFVRWLPDGKRLLFGKARGGDENTQFFLINADGTSLLPLTDNPQIRYNYGDMTADGEWIFYSSNKRDRRYFNIYRMNLKDGREELLLGDDGNYSVAAVNDNGSFVIVSKSGTELSLDNDLFLLDVRKKGLTHLTPHRGASEFSDPVFTADGFFLSHNDQRDFSVLEFWRQKSAARGNDWSPENLVKETVYAEDNSDIDSVAANRYISVLAFTVNRNGYSKLFVKGIETDGKPLVTSIKPIGQSIELPREGIISGLEVSSDGSKLAFAFNSPIDNTNIWVADLKTKKVKKITSASTAGIRPASFVRPELIKFKSFDGLEVTGWYYPAKVLSRRFRRQPPAVLVSVHGGPEGQERPGFNSLYQYYLSQGYAIFAPNVRGSTGFGKAFSHLDDVRNREDSVRDLAEGVRWLIENKKADRDRIAVMGGSYGGYMTLAAITLYPELWAAAVDTVGIANWETFLKNTSGYRRRQREVEYGRLDRDLDFLRSISPINRVDRIRCPLFVIHGKNDPRVPYTEAEQIVAAIKARGGIVEYKLYDDEGHGISKLKNRLDLYPRVAAFLRQYVLNRKK
jgi:dipeptidyl aminopeptidase/acylaminoacyl peptidase